MRSGQPLTLEEADIAGQASCLVCRSELIPVVRNYLGTGKDVCQCPKCRRHYSVSYRVAAVAPAPHWDVQESHDA